MAALIYCGDRSEPQFENLAAIDWNCLLSSMLYVFANANIKVLDESF